MRKMKNAHPLLLDTTPYEVKLIVFLLKSFPAQEFPILFSLLETIKLATAKNLHFEGTHSGESPSTRPQALIITPATCCTHHS
jgi:hypothetical protein